MEISGFTLNITSDQPEVLVDFYRDVVQLPPDPAFEQFGGGGFLLGSSATLVIDEHSETNGRAIEPQRMLIDFTVADIRAETARLKAAGAIFVREPSPEYWGGLVATFLDPDGNYLQLFQLPRS